MYDSVGNGKIKAETSLETCLNIVAMRRSGHHAIIRWIAGHYSKTTFHNDFGSDGCDIYRNSNDKISGIYNFEDPGSGHCKITNFEDYKIEEVENPTIVILRDPYNCFASRIHADFQLSHTIDNHAIDIWINHAHAFKSGNIYPISYNQWVSSEIYRRKISKFLQKPYSLNHIQQVSPFGQWSSFDKNKYISCADKMDIFNRWKHCIQDQKFRKIMTNLKIVNLSCQIFGNIGFVC